MVVYPEDNEADIPRRGRPRVRRGPIGCGPLRCYAPQCEIVDAARRVVLRPDEIEILRLIDLEDLEQEEAAQVLGISRKTLWKDLHEARRKVTDALVHGKFIEFSGCPRKNLGECPRQEEAHCPKQNGGMCPRGCMAQDESNIE
ncbi:MAG TPA: DUF134 domain-containing protein [Methanospirillum sp.]|nr:DUF134 domain-containing protein [Methanospirillum sp.]